MTEPAISIADSEPSPFRSPFSVSVDTMSESEPEIFVTMIGSVALATPTAKLELTPRQMEHVEEAWVAASEGRLRRVEILVSRIERRIWPKGFDPHHELRRRALAANPEAVRLENRRGQHRRKLEERKRAAQLNAPLAAPQFDGALQKLVKDLAAETEKAGVARKEANASRDRKDHKAHRAALGRERTALDAIRRLRRRIEDNRTSQLDRRWVEGAKSETDHLATDRGDPLADDHSEVADWLRDEDGAMVKEGGLPVLRFERAKVRRNVDPVLSLGRPAKPGASPNLNDDQFSAAIKLRDIYAARKSDLGAVDPSSQTSGSRDHESFVAGRFVAAQAVAMVHQVEMAILLGACRDSKGPREIAAAEAFRRPASPNRHVALALLRAVCAEGKSLTSQGSGRAFEGNLRALKIALNVAHEVIAGRKPDRARAA